MKALLARPVRHLHKWMVSVLLACTICLSAKTSPAQNPNKIQQIQHIIVVY